MAEKTTAAILLAKTCQLFRDCEITEGFLLVRAFSFVKSTELAKKKITGIAQ